MIEKIIIKNVATYNESGVIIENLKKINIVYGANGTGKTTISRFLDNSYDQAYYGSEIKWRSDRSRKCLVYNKEFRDKNFGTGKLNGVFTLGSDSKSDYENIEKLNDKRTRIESRIDESHKSLSRLKGDYESNAKLFKDEVWNELYKKNENDFKLAFKGFMTRELFLKEVYKYFDEGETSTDNYESLVERVKLLKKEQQNQRDFLQIPDDRRLTEIIKESIWKKNIVGKVDINISKIIQRMNNSDWVNIGRKYIESSDTCPFCQSNTITEEFRKNLNDYFDETYESDINLLGQLLEEYTSRARLYIKTINDNIEKTKSYYSSNDYKDKLADFVLVLESKIQNNINSINEKQREPSRSISLKDTKEETTQIHKELTSINGMIQDHNQILENIKSEKKSIVKRVWAYFINVFRARINAHVKKQFGITKGIDKLEASISSDMNEVDRIKNEIKELIAGMTSIQPSVDIINKILFEYGFNNFKIIASPLTPNYYTIQREDGTLAESTLSEGEITFITFLYYYQLTKGSTEISTVNDERIIVIDDPISSLDSNVLFVVSSLIKQIRNDVLENTGNIKQLFILTHNVYFHKEVSYINSRNSTQNEIGYWVLYKKNNVSHIINHTNNNPIKSSYQLLWYEFRKLSVSNISIQNTMRRILECYFKIMGNYKDDKILDCFESDEKLVVSSLISWVNDGSHGVPDDLSYYNEDENIDKYKQVFKKIFDVMGHLNHYLMMMGEDG